MPLFMMYTFVVCGCLLSLQVLMDHPRVEAKPGLMALILLPVAVVICAVLRMCTHVLGGPQDILLLFSVIFPFGLIAMGIRGMKHHGQRVNKLMVALLAIFVLAIGYVTLFSRDGTSSTKILFGFYKIQHAFASGSVEPLGHVLLNIALFLPFGFCLAGCCHQKSDKLLYVLVAGIVFTTSIESIQYALRIGECDLEDLVANVLGALLGWGGYKLFVKTK